MKRPTLHWVCHSPSPYNDVLFRTLAKSSEFNLQVHYVCEDAEAWGYHWERKTDRGYPFRCFGIGTLDRTLIRAVLGDRTSLFLTTCWQDRTCELILSVLMLLRRPYLVWSDTPMPRKRGWLKSRARALFLKTVFAHAKKVLGAGTPALNEFANMGCPGDKLMRLPSCIDLGQFVPQDRAEPDTALVLGTSARLHRIKGIDIALRALARFARSSNTAFRYKIAGDGPEEDTLRKMCGELGLTNHVEFCGWLQPEQLPRFYQSLDVYLHPARFEPYGVAILEALACGLPVVATDTTMSAVDRITEEVSGFFYPAEDEGELVRVIERFSSLSRQKRDGMKDAARQAAVSWTDEDSLRTIDRIVRDIAPSVINGVADPIEKCS